MIREAGSFETVVVRRSLDKLLSVLGNPRLQHLTKREAEGLQGADSDTHLLQKREIFHTSCYYSI